MSPYPPDERVMVSPRYMAGAGDRIADVIGPLIHLFGWNVEHDAGNGDVGINSPDGSVSVDFVPLHPLGRWCKVVHHEPYWEAVFSRQAPLEAVAAFTQALPQLLGDDRHAEQIPLTREPLDQVAALNGWSAEGSSFVSPDLYCRIEHTPDADDAWKVEHVYFEKDPLATFMRRTPEHLVGNFFAHLATPIAVERAFADIPLSTRYENSGLITPVRGAAINPQVAHALAQLGRPRRR
ncbi:uncharacterized protein DUF317 [Streptomyces sp. 840.1]|uniref:DUF317 domain-containing protein n=1 Tax=Streptomyces sp. 840.1 TaxID=2485152 RepID=UPI000F49718E|nr:DUF317 domain-containing protein [Streptomyces sp. 840.1]ROQ70149.1 uncharacterized protein DUF317 [Streptomyces sp. 840.1]